MLYQSLCRLRPLNVSSCQVPMKGRGRIGRINIFFLFKGRKISAANPLLTQKVKPHCRLTGQRQPQNNPFYLLKCVVETRLTQLDVKICKMETLLTQLDFKICCRDSIDTVTQHSPALAFKGISHSFSHRLRLHFVWPSPS